MASESMKTEGKTSIVEIETREYIARIRSYYGNMSKSEKLIADYLVAEQEASGDMTIGELAEATGTSISTVVRFCRTLGFKGFAEFKYHMQKNILAPIGGDIKIGSSDSIAAIKQKVTESIIGAVHDFSDTVENAELERALSAISKAKQLMFSGDGSTFGIAHTAATAFSSLGIQSFAHADSLNQLRSLHHLGRDDVVIGITTCGYIKNVADVLASAQKLGLTTICITSVPNTLSTKYADIVLLNPFNNVLQPLDLSATVICQLITVYMLQIGVLVRNNDRLLKKALKMREFSDLKHYDQSTEALEIKRMHL